MGITLGRAITLVGGIGMLRVDDWNNEKGGWLKGTGGNWEGFGEAVIGMGEFMKEKGGGCGRQYIPIGCTIGGSTLGEGIGIVLIGEVLPML